MQLMNMRSIRRVTGSMSFVRVKNLTKVFVTHMHGDHVYGLPSILISQLTKDASIKRNDANASKIHVYGPFGLREYLRTIADLTTTYFLTDAVRSYLSSFAGTDGLMKEW